MLFIQFAKFKLNSINSKENLYSKKCLCDKNCH